MHNFATVEELTDERERVDSEYDGGLPDYLVDYFDDQERKLLKGEFFKELHHTKINKTQE